MEAQEIIQTESAYVLQTYVRPDILFTYGEGVYLFDADGRKYLDFTSGIGVTALGHSDPDWVTAVSQQASKLTHVSNLFHTTPQTQLAQKLVENSFADKVFFCNSGAEANEAALKFARKFGKLAAGNAAKTKIVAFSGGFHGRTMGSLSVTHKAKYREPFAPLLPGITFAPFNDLAAARAAIDNETCAVIVEPIQGEGGVNPATPGFLQLLRTACNAHNALLIFDEVQCGLGRTGQLWAHRHFGVTPDMMTLAKPLAGGLPIGATLVTQKVADVIKPGDHGSTFAAGPLVCAAANVVFDKVSQLSFLKKVQENGAYLRHRLQGLELGQITEVRGQGLLVGVSLNQPAAPIMAAARAKGVLILTAGENVVRLAPPLIVGRDEIDTAVHTIAACLNK
ncbi:Acetylornithine aminotransferase [hydrothermal vent metagenome]|uniref:Acetylornithine aminotransferase n=1 Tax=hydrothermal vent metagenome TaxID=652676 RepID=A0A3B0VB01_9ZZZZ